MTNIFNKPTASFTGKDISLTCISLMFLLPFITMYHNLPIISFYAEWIAATLGLVAVISLKSTVWRNTLTTIKVPPIAIVFLGLAIIICLQWALGMLHSNQYALLVLSYLTWAFLLVLLGSYLRRELGWEKLVTSLAWSLVFAGIINTGIVALQYVTRTGGSISFLSHWSGYGMLSQANHFADFCALATISLIYLYSKERFSTSFFTLILLCFLVMLSFSGSRSAWLYLTASTIFSVVMHISTIKRDENSTIAPRFLCAIYLLIPGFILIQIFIYLVVPNELINLPTERIVDAADVNTPSARLHIWYDSLRLFLQSPWLGIGAGNMRGETFLLLDKPTAMAFNRIFEHAHNLFLHLSVEMGISAFLITFICLLDWIISFKWKKLNLETWWLISLLAVLGIHSMLEYPLWYAYFLGTVAFLLGAGAEKIVSVNFSKITSNISCKIYRLSLIVFFLLGVINLSTLLIANIKLENWMHKFAYENVNDKAQLNWVNRYSLFLPYSELMQAMTMKIDTNNIDEDILLNQSVMNFRPFQTITFQHAFLLQLKGQHADAVKQLNRALTAYPGKFQSALENIPLEYRKEYLNLHSAAQLSAANKLNKKANGS